MADETTPAERLKIEWQKYKLIAAIVAIVGVAVSIATISITVYNINLLDVQEAVAKACIDHGGEWVVGPDGQKECLRTSGE